MRRGPWVIGATAIFSRPSRTTTDVDTMTQQRFSGKTVWLTGAGGGIGRECAIAFARAGAAVAILDRDKGSLADTARLMEQHGGRSLEICADVTDARKVAAAFEQAVEAFGQIDYAFNNAGISQRPAPTVEVEPDEWERVLRVNVTGVWLCMREQIRHMAKRGSGVIVNMASFAGLRTLPMNSAYVASKHAVVGLTKNAAVEYAAQGIRINAVAPGGIPTPMMDKSLLGLDSAQRAAALEQFANFHPMKRLGSVREIADLVLFLCSDEASFITGTCLPIDGGWAAT
jgi:NAD(P)-dependent dehydrogenase (short-subunit alcohol dehydrogenase family)